MSAISDRCRRPVAPLWGAALATALLTTPQAKLSAAEAAMPRYTHIFVIVMENKGYEQILGSGSRAPNINALAEQYGLASQFYAEVHPSQGNYVAMLGGDTFGISDDDAFYCKPKMQDGMCPKSNKADYV